MIVKVSASELTRVIYKLNGEESWCPESFNLLFWSLIPVQSYEEYHIFICSQATTIKSSDRGESCKENFIKMDSQSK